MKFFTKIFALYSRR